MLPLRQACQPEASRDIEWTELMYHTLKIREPNALKVMIVKMSSTLARRCILSVTKWWISASLDKFNFNKISYEPEVEWNSKIAPENR